MQLINWKLENAAKENIDLEEESKLKNRKIKELKADLGTQLSFYRVSHNSDI